MIERFVGTANLAKLVNTLRQQPAIYDKQLADEVAGKVKLSEFKTGELLIRQGDSVARACCNRSPSNNCSHKVLPFVEASAKTKLASSIETQPGDHFAATV